MGGLTGVGGDALSSNKYVEDGSCKCTLSCKCRQSASVHN